MERREMPLPARILTITGRAAGLLLAGLLCGCALNPFGDDEAPPPPAAQNDRAGESRAGSMSLEAPRSRSEPLVTGEERGDAAGGERSAVPIAPDAPERYVVERGDTLWDISETFLADPWYWPEIWQVNPQIENPHLIYPGDVLTLVYIDGRPRLMLERAIVGERLSPQIRTQPLDEAINTIPYEQIAAFLTRAMVLEKDEIEALPYIVAARGNHLISAAGNDVYTRGDIAGPGARYSVVHVGDPLVDPDDGRLVGYEGLYVGQGQVRRTGDPATVNLVDTEREALAGDRLVPRQVDIPLNFFPKPPDTEIDGRIISVIDGLSLIGQYQVIVINRGARDGLAPGDVLSTFDAGEVVRDRYKKLGYFSGSAWRGGEKVRLPDERSGTVMLFKVYDRIAYALVMEAESDIHVLDPVRNPT